MYKRFVVEGEVKDKINISGEEHNHLSNVLRLKVGDKIIVTNGTEFDYICKILTIEKKSTLCEVVSKERNTHNPNKTIDVYQALIKNDKMSLLTQKLSEVGASNLILFETKFQTVKPSENKKDKLQKISDQSSKQCKRSIPLKVSEIITFKEMLNMINNYDLAIFANETEGTVRLSEMVEKIKNHSKIAVIIGSEGGFDKSDIEQIIKAGAISVSLGNRILKAETASMTLASFVSFCSNN